MAVAGRFIIGIVLTSAAITGYESVDRLFHPRPITHIGAVIIASASDWSATKSWRAYASGPDGQSAVRHWLPMVATLESTV